MANSLKTLKDSPAVQALLADHPELAKYLTASATLGPAAINSNIAYLEKHPEDYGYIIGGGRTLNGLKTGAGHTQGNNLPAVQDTTKGFDLAAINNGLAALKKYDPALYKARYANDQNILAATQAAQTLDKQQTGANANLYQSLYGPDAGLKVPALAANPIQDQINAIVAQQLQHPYQLPVGVQNEAASGGASQAGAAGILPGAGGQALTARSLGLEALDVGNQRLAFGNQVGQQQVQLNQAQQALQEQVNQINQANKTAGASYFSGSAQNQTQLANGLQPALPKVGLNGTDAANYKAALDNIFNTTNAQKSAQQTAALNQALSLGSNLAGTAAGAAASVYGGPAAGAAAKTVVTGAGNAATNYLAPAPANAATGTYDPSTGLFKTGGSIYG